MKDLIVPSQNQPYPTATEYSAKVIPIDHSLRASTDIPRDYMQSKLCISLTEGCMILPIQKIKRLEADSNYTIIHTTDEKRIVVSRTMKVLIKTLPESMFIQCHKSHVVNIDHITFITKTSILLEGDEEVPISRKKSKVVIENLKSIFLSF